MNSRRLMPSVSSSEGGPDRLWGAVKPPPVLDPKDSTTTGWQTALLHCGISVVLTARLRSV
jgi:hypothetical protein